MAGAGSARWEFTHHRLRTIIITIAPGRAADRTAVPARKMARYRTEKDNGGEFIGRLVVWLIREMRRFGVCCCIKVKFCPGGQLRL